jgi:hypothetical protein
MALMGGLEAIRLLTGCLCRDHRKEIEMIPSFDPIGYKIIGARKEGNKMKTENQPLGWDKREKHIELHQAIMDMDIIIRELDDLVDRMQGPTPHTGEKLDPEAIESLPNFMDVLDGAAGLIRIKIDAIQERIALLNEMLF